MPGFDPAHYEQLLHEARLDLAIVFNPSAHPRGAAGSGTGGRFIASGASGTPVQKVQVAVGANPNGVYDEDTKEAVEDFQRRLGLAVDGIVGSQTAAAILGQKAMAPGALTAQQKTLLAGLNARKGSRKATGSRSSGSRKSSKPTGPIGTTNPTQALREAGLIK